MIFFYYSLGMARKPLSTKIENDLQKEIKKLAIDQERPLNDLLEEAIRDLLKRETDITKDIEMHGKLFNGNSYIIIDKNNKSALNLFMDLTSIDFHGLLITRDTSQTIENNLDTSNMLNLKSYLINIFIGTIIGIIISLFSLLQLKYETQLKVVRFLLIISAMLAAISYIIVKSLS